MSEIRSKPYHFRQCTIVVEITLSIVSYLMVRLESSLTDFAAGRDFGRLARFVVDSVARQGKQRSHAAKLRDR